MKCFCCHKTQTTDTPFFPYRGSSVCQNCVIKYKIREGFSLAATLSTEGVKHGKDSRRIHPVRRASADS
jgi:hypothetical protein